MYQEVPSHCLFIIQLLPLQSTVLHRMPILSALSVYLLDVIHPMYCFLLLHIDTIRSILQKHVYKDGGFAMPAQQEGVSSSK